MNLEYIQAFLEPFVREAETRAYAENPNGFYGTSFEEVVSDHLRLLAQTLLEQNTDD